MIRLVTDSASMIPSAIRDRFAVEVVPMIVTIGGHEFSEGLGHVTTEQFYARLASGEPVSTSAPPPGSFVEAYRQAIEEGADRILSIHTGSGYSAAVAAASVATTLVDVEVSVVDTGLASFPVTLCVWSAAEELEHGRGAAAAIAAANATATSTGSVFVVGVPDLARSGGRFAALDSELSATSILELDAKGLREIDRVDDIETAIDRMVDHVRSLAAERPLRAGIGDALRPAVADVLAERLQGAPGIGDLVRYEVGPSVGAHTGAGTVGVVYAPTEPDD
jgi:DegV family protein with EDD domain